MKIYYALRLLRFPLIEVASLRSNLSQQAWGICITVFCLLTKFILGAIINELRKVVLAAGIHRGQSQMEPKNGGYLPGLHHLRNLQPTLFFRPAHRNIVADARTDAQGDGQSDAPNAAGRGTVSYAKTDSVYYSR